MNTMTLEQVRALCAEWGEVPSGSVQMPSLYLRRMRDAIDAALAQNAQGEAWGYIGAREKQTLAQHGHAQVLARPLPELGITTPVYLHAERARVPEDDVLGAIGMLEAMANPDGGAITKSGAAQIARVVRRLAAAPSQPAPDGAQ